MSLVSTHIGAGFSGSATLAGIPLLLLPANAPENENLHKSDGAYHPDPARSTGELPAKQRRSLVVSLQTLVTPRIWPLLKSLTYGWRSRGQIDGLPEVPFTYVAGGREGYRGTAHVDEVTLTIDPGSLIAMGITFTSWVWEEVGDPSPPPREGTPVLNPLDSVHRPVPGWAVVIRNSMLSGDSIPMRAGLRLANNWNYQGLLEGYQEAPNPALITAGRLGVSLDMTWMARRRDRPQESGSVSLQVGVSPVLGTMVMDRMIREPLRQFENVGNPDEPIQWQASFYLQGNVPRS